MTPSLPRVRVTGGEHAGLVGHRVCRASDLVFVRLVINGTVDQVPVPERYVEVVP